MGIAAFSEKQLNFNHFKLLEDIINHPSMKKLFSILFILAVLVSGCNKKKSEVEPDFKGLFRIEFSDGQVIDQNQIEFYDFSSSLIYLKPGVTFAADQKSGTFDVFADNEKVYTGVIHPMYFSYLPVNAYISTMPSMYGKDVIHIDFSWNKEKPKQDPRKDNRIIAALKRNNQYREGLSGEIVKLVRDTSGKIMLQLQLTNNDAEDLYYLDPKKMGTGLFHYFTIGLWFTDSSRSYMSYTTTTAPTPQNSWKQEWLSLLKSKQSTIVELEFEQFSNMSAGTYTAFFRYPGLANQIMRNDLYQNNARIWLGDIEFSKPVSFN